MPIVSQVRGRVIEVPVENNRPVKKGDVLFKIDPTPYQNEVASLEARLASEEAKVGADRQRLAEAEAKLPDAVSGEKQLREQQNAAAGQVKVLQASLQLAQTRVKQNTELVKTGAGPRFDLEQAQTNVDELTAQLAAARAAEQQVKEKLDGRVTASGRRSSETRAQIATARAQVQGGAGPGRDDAGAARERPVGPRTDDRARAGNGTMVNVMLRPGFFVAGMPFNEVMTFVDDEYQIFALFGQNELHQVDPHNEAEITLDTYPGRIIKAHVDSVIWAQGQGQVEASGDLPKTTFVPPPGRFPVKLVSRTRTKRCSWRRAHAAPRRSTPSTWRSFTSSARSCCGCSRFDYVIIKHSISLGH